MLGKSGGMLPLNFRPFEITFGIFCSKFTQFTNGPHCVMYECNEYNSDVTTRPD